MIMFLLLLMSWMKKKLELVRLDRALLLNWRTPIIAYVGNYYDLYKYH